MRSASLGNPDAKLSTAFCDPIKSKVNKSFSLHLTVEADDKTNDPGGHQKADSFLLQLNNRGRGEIFPNSIFFF